MHRFVSAAYLHLLQSPMYFKEDDPESLKMFGIAAGALVFFGIAVHFVRVKIQGPKGKTSASGFTGQRMFSGLTLIRIAFEYRLDREQKKLLEFVLKLEGTSDPKRLLQQPESLDRIFIQALKSIERNTEKDDQLQKQKSKLFTLRNIIESGPVRTTVTLAGDIKAETPAKISTATGTYNVKVAVPKNNGVVVQIPETVHLAKGSGVLLLLFVNTPQGYSIDAKVLGNVSMNNHPCIQLAYSGQPRPLVQRHFKRKQMNTGCSINLVSVRSEKRGRKKNSKLVVEKRSHKGIMQDISIGGCAISTSAPAQRGRILKLEFQCSLRSTVSVLGQVIKSGNSSGSGSVIHVKFTKIPRRAFNEINSFIFGYS